MKNISIELIGVSGSGKSYTEGEIRNTAKNYLKIYNRREIILKFANKILNLSFKERLAIFYFNLIKIKKKKQIKQLELNKKIQRKNIDRLNLGNYFRINYLNLCKKIFDLYCIKNRKFKKQLDILIQNLKYIEKEHVLFWFYELCAARYIFEKTNKKNYIFLNDEGFIPKSFLFFYTKLKPSIKKKRILKYLDTIKYPDICILLYKDKKDIFKIHEKRKKYNAQLYLEKKILIDIFKINKDIEKHLKKKIRIIKFKNNHKILEKLILIIKNNI